MKIVLDTNVLISGIFFTGPPYQILKAWQEGKIKITASEEILSEYQRLAEELSIQFPTVNIDRILELITIHAEVVDASDFQITICEDPDDNKFIACALASKSKIIVSGDKHLINISGYEGIQVVKPREFSEKYLTKR
jgi:putative PIN family toxin of toxin-antitoxin system